MAFTRTLIADFALANRFYSNAQVTFYQVDAVTGAKLATLVTLYEEVSGTETLANPIKLDAEGKLKAYIDEPTIAEIQTADTALDHDTGIIQTNLAGDSATEAANSAAVAQGAAVLSEEFSQLAAQAALAVPLPGALQHWLRGNGSNAYILRSSTQTRSDLAVAGLADANVFTKTQTWADGGNVASAAALILGDGNLFTVTGTTAITSIGTKGVGTVVVLRFADVLTLTHDAADLSLFTSANISTAAGDTAAFEEYATGDWRMIGYARANGRPLVATGNTLQVVNTQDGEVATGTTTIPFDDTIPQNTEGDEYMTLAITPTDASNILQIDVVINFTNTAVNPILIAALFQDTTAGALVAAAEQIQDPNDPMCLNFSHRMVAGTTSATTFKVRAGSESAGTTTFNGQLGGRIFGGVLGSSITIKEISA